MGLLLTIALGVVLGGIILANLEEVLGVLMLVLLVGLSVAGFVVVLAVLQAINNTAGR